MVKALLDSTGVLPHSSRLSDARANRGYRLVDEPVFLKISNVVQMKVVSPRALMDAKPLNHGAKGAKCFYRGSTLVGQGG